MYLFRQKLYFILKILLTILGGCFHVKFHPGMKLVPGRNHPCLWWNVSYCLHVFAEMKFRLRMNSSLSKRQGWKKEKRTCKHFLPEWNFKMSMFFLNFWRMYSNMLSKVNLFEHNESMSIMKHNVFLLKVKSEKKKDEDYK